MRDAFTLQECANADEMLIEEIEVPEGGKEYPEYRIDFFIFFLNTYAR